MRVATFAMNDKMLEASLKTQARMAELQLQQASGQKSTDYGGLGSTTQKTLNLEISIERSKSYESAASEASDRIQVMYDALSTFSDVLSSFRSDLTAMRSTDSTSGSYENLASAAQSYLQELSAALNTQYEGRYLFAGQATTTAPIDLSQYSLADPATPSTDYYQGDGQIQPVQVSAEQWVSYGITADNQAFEEAIRALSTVADSGGVNEDTLESVYDLVLSATDKTAALQGSLSVKASTLERAATTQADFQQYVSSSLSNLKEADVTAIAVELTAYETQLQASYSALAQIQAINLLDYLR